MTRSTASAGRSMRSTASTATPISPRSSMRGARGSSLPSLHLPRLRALSEPDRRAGLLSRLPRSFWQFRQAGEAACRAECDGVVLTESIFPSAPVDLTLRSTSGDGETRRDCPAQSAPTALDDSPRGDVSRHVAAGRRQNRRGGFSGQPRGLVRPRTGGACPPFERPSRRRQPFVLAQANGPPDRHRCPGSGCRRPCSIEAPVFLGSPPGTSRRHRAPRPLLAARWRYKRSRG